MTESPRLSRRHFLGGLTALAAAAAVPHVASPAYASGRRPPRIYSAREWGARPPADALTRIAERPNKIIIHHTAFPNVEDFSLEYAFQNSRDIQNLHMDGNGWSDSGQHFTNSRGGFITEGRTGSLNALRSGRYMIQGAHCVGQNTQAIGIENDGSYHLGDPVPQAQWDSLVAFCVYACDNYRIPATEIYGHMDFNATQCPGGLHERLPELRAAVQARL
ncbi:peptidoglycan recognition family protein [Microbacterium sp. NPDC056234]|uniref:peptidoglycan recognition protein family protein n=1 Tax=Microbacterium sp. NPDC056234 TaxID=3345757 RepID=UPI0035E07090